MPDINITRDEYETRHAELRAEILAVETRLNTQITGLSGKIDAISTNVGTIATKITALDAANKVSFWRTIATSLITFLMGGGVGTLIEILRK